MNNGYYNFYFPDFIEPEKTSVGLKPFETKPAWKIHEEFLEIQKKLDKEENNRGGNRMAYRHSERIYASTSPDAARKLSRLPNPAKLF